MISEREKQEIAEVYFKRGVELGIEQSIEEGKKQGFEMGIKLAKIDTAKRMLAHGYDVAEIMAITKLTESEIDALKSTTEH